MRPSLQARTESGVGDAVTIELPLRIEVGHVPPLGEEASANTAPDVEMSRSDNGLAQIETE